MIESTAHTTKSEIDPSEYMAKGWDSASYTAHPYIRGSRHNKIGITILWSYYTLFICMLIRLIILLNQ